MKFGRNRPSSEAGPMLRLESYLLKRALPVAPPTTDYSRAARRALANPYLNDALLDCVIAGAYHIVGVETGNAGRLFTATKRQILADYSAIEVHGVR